MRHLDERETAQHLFRSLLSPHGQATLLPVTFLPPKLLERVRTYAQAEGYDVRSERSGECGETIYLVPRGGVDCDEAGTHTG